MQRGRRTYNRSTTRGYCRDCWRAVSVWLDSEEEVDVYNWRFFVQELRSGYISRGVWSRWRWFRHVWVSLDTARRHAMGERYSHLLRWICSSMKGHDLVMEIVLGHIACSWMVTVLWLLDDNVTSLILFPHRKTCCHRMLLTFLHTPFEVTQNGSCKD